jgi:hypothetical protein
MYNCAIRALSPPLFRYAVDVLLAVFSKDLGQQHTHRRRRRLVHGVEGPPSDKSIVINSFTQTCKCWQGPVISGNFNADAGATKEPLPQTLKITPRFFLLTEKTRT